MKFVNIILATLALLFAACETDNYEVNKLQKTGVYFIENTTQGSSPEMYTLYYELNSLLVWTNNTSIEGDYKIVELRDYSFGESRIFDFVVEGKDGALDRYSVNAPFNGIAAVGTLQVTKQGERTVTYKVMVSDETRETDEFN